MAHYPIQSDYTTKPFISCIKGIHPEIEMIPTYLLIKRVLMPTWVIHSYCPTF